MIDKITNTVSKVLNTKTDASTSQKNCVKWDSLMHIRIVIALEDAFGLSFEPEEIARMTSIGNIEAIISNKEKQ